MAQQTAVEWLMEEIRMTDKALYNLFFEDGRFEQAKQMEKEQLHKCASFWRGKENEIEKPIFQQYYNETFNK